MNKHSLESYIEKYSLNGIIQSVKWKNESEKKKLSTSAITDEKNVLVFVDLVNFSDLSEDCEIGVLDTPKLTKMLSVLGDSVNMTLNKTDDVITSLTFNDGSTDVKFVTADLSVIPTAPNLKKTPQFQVEIELDKDFVDKFIRAKSSLPEVDTFTLMMNKKTKKLELVLGYSSLNSNRITLSVKTKDGKDTVDRNISFSAKYLKEILSANTDSTASIFSVSNDGLAVLKFSNADYNSTYYIVETKTSDQ